MLGSKKPTSGGKQSVFGNSGSTTLLSRDTVVVGDIHFSGNLEIEGLVQGNIIALPEQDAFVRIVQEGRVEGEIRAPSIVINGAIEGDVYSSKHLELASKARVHGDVYYTLVEMAAGSEVNGILKHVVDSPGQTKTPASTGGVPTKATAQGGEGRSTVGKVD